MANVLTKSASQQSQPDIHPGDIVRVHQKISEGGKERIQVFEGIVIKTHLKTGPNATFTVRKIASGVGVERTYLKQSPNIVKIEFKKGSKVRRAKLYYLRNLSGKALKMKDKKIDKDVWELVTASGDAQAEPTADDLAEAVEQATPEETPDASSTPVEPAGTEGNTENTETIEPVPDDTVEAEESDGGETKDSGTQS